MARGGSALGVALALLFTSAEIGHAEEIRGRLVVGSNVYEVLGRLRERPDGSIRLSFAILGGPSGLREVDVVSEEQATTVSVNGESQPVDSATAARWRRQIKSAFLSVVEGVSPADAGIRRVYDSPGIVALASGLPGRMRLVYTKTGRPEANGPRPVLVSSGYRLTEVRLFSLAEWNNVFMQYVSLSLEFK